MEESLGEENPEPGEDGRRGLFVERSSASAGPSALLAQEPFFKGMPPCRAAGMGEFLREG